MPEPLPYGRQSVDESDVAAVAAVLRGDWLTTGPAVAAFETAVEAVAGAPAVSVTSGTAALHTAYAAAGVGRGDEVVCTPMTFVATASAAVALGARIVFADIEDEHATLDPRAAAAAVSRRTKVIAAVDYAGHPADYTALREAARDGLLLADAAHSLGGTWHGRPVGSLADLTTFSFFATKNMTTAEGGAVTTADPRLLHRARKFRNHGLVRETHLHRTRDEGGWHQEAATFGLNYRLPDVLCALGTSQLARLTAFKRRRAEIAARYDTHLADLPGLRLPARHPAADPVWHLYAVRVLEDRRRGLYEHLRAEGILAQVNYVPVYWHPVFEDMGYRRGMCPVAERFYAEQLSLPLYPNLTDGDVDRVVEAVHGFFGS